jgi:hypothetical protein
MPCIPGQNADGGNVDILTWWMENGQKKFTHVAVMARQYLSVRASSAIVERIFSIVGLTFSDSESVTCASLLKTPLLRSLCGSDWMNNFLKAVCLGWSRVLPLFGQK